VIHTDLPIHRTGVKLLALAIEVQQNMPRGVKRSLGDRIAQHCVDMLDLMALANATRHAERAAHIRHLMTAQRAVQVLLRVSVDARYISPKRWAAAIELLDSIGKQGNGWLSKTANKAPAA
jgi:hypothetical protein